MNLVIEKSQPAYEQLPDTFSLLLENFSAITLSGEEQTKYLQGQVTCDVAASDKHSLMHGAHCNAKGKVFSIFRLINRFEQHLLLQDQATIELSLAELKKYGVFAKVEIEQSNELAFAAVVGDNAEALVQERFNRTPNSLTPVIQVEQTTIVFIASTKPRYLLIDSNDAIAKHLENFALPIWGHAVWQLLEIHEGFPVLGNSTIAEHAPQVFNVQALNGISFTKGCYLGQETVARMQYLGKNKRALYSLQSEITAELSDGDIIERQIGDNWRRAGEVVNSYQSDAEQLNIQAILSSDITADDNLRIKGIDDAEVTVLPLPYSLTS